MNPNSFIASYDIRPGNQNDLFFSATTQTSCKHYLFKLSTIGSHAFPVAATRSGMHCLKTLLQHHPLSSSDISWKLLVQRSFCCSHFC